ncbi:MAG: hypothetical protein QQN63_07220 [Nitrosopumilus sp.]
MAYTNSGWPTNIPAGSDNLNTADDQLRRLRLDLKERFNDIVDDITTDPVVLAFLQPDVPVVYTNASFAIPSGVTTAIDFVAETLDTGNPTADFHDNSVNPERLTIATAAYYRITANIQVTPGATGAVTFLYIRKNGSIIASQRVIFAGSSDIEQMFVTIIDLAAAADFYDAAILQASGDSWNTGVTAADSYFMIEKLLGVV